MGFGDKFKDLRQQAKEVVAENRGKIQEAVDAASVAANEKTGGKYANKIMKVNEKTGSALDKFGAGDAGGTEAAQDPQAAAVDPQAAAVDPQAAAVAQEPQDYTPPSFADDAPTPTPAPPSTTAESSSNGPQFDE